jgi:hypothetical protein
MKQLKTNAVELNAYKLTISRRSFSNTNFKNNVIDSTPVIIVNIDSSGIRQEKLERIDEWSGNYWNLKDDGGVKKSEQYEDDLKREIYDATVKVYLRWMARFNDELANELKD